jgi:DHA1 family bicyclomycin/chloramphenicol resistance-like MFS transporter
VLSTGLAVVVLTLLVALQPITTDLYLPALPLLVAGLKTSVASVQMTLSLLMISYGIGQLAWGPVSDRWGRRPVLLAGLSLYGLAAAAAGPHQAVRNAAPPCRLPRAAPARGIRS